MVESIISSGQWSVSAMHFIQSGIGKGPFVRADLGLAACTTLDEDGDECLNREMLLNLREGRVVIADWRQHYNRETPHSFGAISAQKTLYTPEYSHPNRANY